MKKAVALIGSLALILSLAAVSVFAASTTTKNTINQSTGSASHDVKATYVAGSAGGTVYSVDITWGDMEFTYKAGSEGTWNPEPHTTSGSSAGQWTVNNEGGNKIVVTNHSNAAITATLTYTPASGYNGISGSFGEKGSINLVTAVGTEVNNAPTDTAYLTLSGELDSNTANSTKIGTITVVIR